MNKTHIKEMIENAADKKQAIGWVRDYFVSKDDRRTAWSAADIVERYWDDYRGDENE